MIRRHDHSMSAIVLASFALVAVIVMAGEARATWKPSYGNEPVAVQNWFRTAPLTPQASIRFGFENCCEQAERLRTKFVPTINGDWAYYPDPTCTHDGCQLLPIPADVVHSDPIRAINPKDNDLPEFKEMRREGVLFIWQGIPTCFWPPEPST